MDIRLNLLPPQQKKRLQNRRDFYEILNQQIVLSFLLIFFMSGIAAVNLILTTQLQNLTTLNENLLISEGYHEVNKLQTKFVEANMVVGSVQAFYTNNTDWFDVLYALGENIPDTISVQTIKTSDNQIIVSGTARSVDDLVRIQEDLATVALDEKLCFSDISIPDSYLVQQKSADFEMTLVVNVENCMKK